MWIFVFLQLCYTWGLFFWPLDTFLLWFILTSDNRFLVHFQITCTPWQPHLPGRFFLFLSAFVLLQVLRGRIPRRISQNRQEAGRAIPTLRISSVPHWDINLKAQRISASMRSIWTSSESQAILPSLQRTSDLQELRGDADHDRQENGICFNTATAAKAQKPPKIFEGSIKTPQTTAPTLVWHPC